MQDDSELVQWFAGWQKRFADDVLRGADAYCQTQPSFWTVMDRERIPAQKDMKTVTNGSTATAIRRR